MTDLAAADATEDSTAAAAGLAASATAKAAATGRRTTRRKSASRASAMPQGPVAEPPPPAAVAAVTAAASTEPGIDTGARPAAAAGGAVPQAAATSAPWLSGSELGKTLRAMGDVTLPLPVLAALQLDYLHQVGLLWNSVLTRSLGVPADPAARPFAGDRRFAGADWTGNPFAAFMAQSYLLNSRALLRMVDALEGDQKAKRRLRFSVQQWIDATSPSNYLAFNPEAQRRALETRGASLSQGVQQMLGDLRRGRVSQSDHDMFEVGRNLAVTEGSVVFENALFQLIEYRPSTPEVHERPLLMVPPFINKFYILDLQPENSFVRHAVKHGHRVFVMSWRNPDESLRTATWDDYAGQGVVRAIDAVLDITGRADRPADEAKLDLLGFCAGGTLLATALAVLAARGRQPANSLTLLTTFLDFADTGVMDVFIDESTVRWRERTIGAASPSGGGLLKGRDLATTFSFLRPNELVWNYVVSNYLMGDRPPPFDLLHWNADSTNIPGPMYAWYLRNTYLDNNLVVPGRATVCGEKVDLGSFAVPTYLYASREDHIVPWQSAYRSTQLLAGPKRFVLGASGHVAGVINPASKNKRSYWALEDAAAGTASDAARAASTPQDDPAPAVVLPEDAQAWLDAAAERPGSWWTDWSAWLAVQAGPMVPAPAEPGSAAYPVIEPAPGRYVRAKA